TLKVPEDFHGSSFTSLHFYKNTPQIFFGLLLAVYNLYDCLCLNANCLNYMIFSLGNMINYRIFSKIKNGPFIKLVKTNTLLGLAAFYGFVFTPSDFWSNFVIIIIYR
ncbi:hypothetical protein ACJX0J_032676, partial [Zea mays]